MDSIRTEPLGVCRWNEKGPKPLFVLDPDRNLWLAFHPGWFEIRHLHENTALTDWVYYFRVVEIGKIYKECGAFCIECRGWDGSVGSSWNSGWILQRDEKLISIARETVLGIGNFL